MTPGQLTSVARLLATLVGGAASVGAVLLRLQSTPAFLVALAVTATLCAALGLEEGIRPACICTAVLLVRPDAHFDEAEEFQDAFDRLLAVVGGGLEYRLEAATAARGAPPPPSG